jgi:hypothetical protein
MMMAFAAMAPERLAFLSELYTRSGIVNLMGGR